VDGRYWIWRVSRHTILFIVLNTIECKLEKTPKLRLLLLPRNTIHCECHVRQVGSRDRRHGLVSSNIGQRHLGTVRRACDRGRVRTAARLQRYVAIRRRHVRTRISSWRGTIQLRRAGAAGIWSQFQRLICARAQKSKHTHISLNHTHSS
jgi:hypothetical protein